jgi:hypothetical protein
MKLSTNALSVIEEIQKEEAAKEQQQLEQSQKPAIEAPV